MCGMRSTMYTMVVGHPLHLRFMINELPADVRCWKCERAKYLQAQALRARVYMICSL